MAVFICQGCGAEHASWEGKCPACGTSETIRIAQQADRMIDRVIKGRFKIIRKLGQGGMGAVYLAEQLGIGHRVALKFLKAELSTDAEIARRFLNEARSYARVAHPNAVALHDFGQDDEGNLFIAMEFCEGVDLKKVIAEQGRLPLIEAVEIVLQVADVLANAHAKGVIHRDLKPENIMIRRGMRGVHAKVLDFGIARLMDGGTRLTMAGSIAGTPRYMSPEQVEGKDVDRRADIYSLGIVLYETLTGRQPFDGATITEILRRQVLEPMPHLAQAHAELDVPALDAVIQRACKKKREERWPDLLTFADALSQAIPTQAHLGLTPLERSGAHAVHVPTNHGGDTGVAVPGAATDQADATAATMVRGSTGVGTAPPEQPSAPGGAPTQLDPPSANGPGLEAVQKRPSLDTTLAPGDAPLVAPRSRAPMIALAASALVVALGGASLLFSGAPAPKELERPVATGSVAPRPEVAPVVTPDAAVAAVAAVVPVGDAIRMLNENAALSALVQGKTAFEQANFPGAETFLKSVPADSASSAEAAQLRDTIATIAATLTTAERLRLAGRCEAAMPLYRKILALNPRVRGAVDGLALCAQGTIDTTMP